MQFFAMTVLIKPRRDHTFQFSPFTFHFVIASQRRHHYSLLIKSMPKIAVREFGSLKNYSYLCTRKTKEWEFSSAGSEHLPYKQRVGGSNPSTPTTISHPNPRMVFFVFRAYDLGSYGETDKVKSEK